MKEKKKIEKQEENTTTKKKQKLKLKNKKIVIPITILFLILLAGGYFGFQTWKDKTLKALKKNYAEYVITTKKTKLYDNKKKVIGEIEKNISLKLEKIKKISIKNTYLKINGTNYYISYKDIKQTKENQKEKENKDYYVSLNQRVKSSKEITLKKDGKTKITLAKGIDAELDYMDEDNYYITFFNDTYTLKKEKDIKLEEKQKIEEKIADHVSIIYYEKISEDCNEENCLKSQSVKAHIEKLRNEGFYTITKEDYLLYINGYVNLKENAIFITTSEINDYVTNLNQELNLEIAKIEENDKIKMETTNKTSRPTDDKERINRYQAKSYTLIDTYTKMARGEDVEDNGKETSDNQGIAVVNYHFFYNPEKEMYCNESICLLESKFREHLEWLNNNNYKTLTIKEFADWMDGIIEVPEKSVLLTIDDGAMGTGAHNGNILIPLLEEYKIHATLFLIAGWWDLSNYLSPYLDVQSHTFNLHFEASCPDGRGMVACSNYQEVKEDLQKSLDVLRDNTSFCFPFYSYDNESLQAVKELGFRVAFVGGNRKARRRDNHWLIPRYPIISEMTLNDFIDIVE